MTCRLATPRAARPAAETVYIGEPLTVLVWLVNELSRIGATLRAGEVVTTGVCAVPPAIAAGDRIEADFGALGAARLRLTV